METRTSGTEPAVVPHQVLSAVSHELRGPLGVARGYLRMLETQLAAEATALKAVGQASRATDQMAAILDEVSRYARLARGEPRLRSRMVSLAEVVSAAISRPAASVAATTDVAVQVPSGVMVWVDPASTAEGLAALATALGRAQLEEAALVFRHVPSDGQDVVTLLLAPRSVQEPAGHARLARLDRSGAGLSLALAELIFRLQGGALEERWLEDTWLGYLVRMSRHATS